MGSLSNEEINQLYQELKGYQDKLVAHRCNARTIQTTATTTSRPTTRSMTDWSRSAGPPRACAST